MTYDDKDDDSHDNNEIRDDSRSSSIQVVGGRCIVQQSLTVKSSSYNKSVSFDSRAVEQLTNSFLSDMIRISCKTFCCN